MPDTYFCTDRASQCSAVRLTRPDKQSFARADAGHDSDEDRWRAEECKRWQLRRKLFPALSDDTVIIACANQLYKVLSRS